MTAPPILPDSRLRTIHTPRATKWFAGIAHQPIFCANCGGEGGFVPEANMRHCFYLCNDCYRTWGHIAGTMAVPDEVFYQRLRDAQMERYARLLSNEEIMAQLGDPESFISKLARDRPHLTPSAGV